MRRVRNKEVPLPLSEQEFSEIELRLRQYEFADSRDRTVVLNVLNEYRARTKPLKPDDKRLSFYGPQDSSESQGSSKTAGDETIAWRSG